MTVGAGEAVLDVLCRFIFSSRQIFGNAGRGICLPLHRMSEAIRLRVRHGCRYPAGAFPCHEGQPKNVRPQDQPVKDNGMLVLALLAVLPLSVVSTVWIGAVITGFHALIMMTTHVPLATSFSALIAD